MGLVEDVRARQAAQRNGEASKPKRAPLAASQVPGVNPGYVKAGIRNGLAELTGQAKPGRNHCLFIQAKSLGRIAGLDRAWLREELLSACEINGLSAEDGEAQTRKTIASGYRAADKEGPREIPLGPEYFENWREVDLSEFGITLEDEDEEEPAPELDTVMAAITAAERDFWERPSLRRVYDAAMMQLCPPWAVLAQCCGRALAMVPTAVRLPGAIGATAGGSLNFYAALVAASGQGKSSAAELAAELVGFPGYPDEPPRERNLGSGEGIVHAFVKTAAKGGRTPSPPVFYPSVLLSCDEIDLLKSMDARSGSTTLAVLRQAFTGGTLGFAYSKSTNNYHLARHTYRLVFMLSGQPQRYGPLLGDVHGGTPQRFMFFPAFDQRLADRPQGQVIPLVTPARKAWMRVPDNKVEIPVEVTRLVRRTRVAHVRGEGDAMSSHEVFVREKFALALAVLDGRIEISEDDWRLAGIGATVSRITRDWIQGKLVDAQDEEDQQAGRRRGVMAEATESEKNRRTALRNRERAKRVAALQRIERTVKAKLADGPMKKRELTQAIAARDRMPADNLLAEVVNTLWKAGEVKYNRRTTEVSL